MIHKFEISGKFFVLDINSSSVHIVDKLVYDVLDFYPFEEIPEELSSKENIAEVVEELAELTAQKTLFTTDIYENIPQRDIGKPIIKALCLHLAHDCNLRCAYCFADEGKFGGKTGLMPKEVAHRAIDFVAQNSAGRQNLEIDFFGGEPLLNFDVLKDTVDYARNLQSGKNFHFTLTTNGLLLDAQKNQYINENMDNVVLSLDGRRSVNDKMRKTPSGAGSHDLILPKFLELIKNRDKDYYVRGTYTRENIDFSQDVLHLYKSGFKHISVEPVVCTGDLSFRDEDLPKLYDEYEKLLDIVRENEIDFFHFNIDLSGGPCVYKRLAGCGAGTQYLAVTPNGDFYPCHQLVGNKKYLLGNVFEGITSPCGELHDLNVYSKEICKNCWAKFFCGGGCVANALNLNGDIYKPYEIGCELQKKRIECALAHYCRLI
ncbi:thioether cross-link-forming SCIFF peptide maturase [Clostridia bacterium]|nr:thioether cross-link-forming SCIFF peptide maturase [Clostridia bacterium]